MKSFKLLSVLICLFLSASLAWGEDLTIDFESATSTYTDWTFTNMTSEQTTITAHGGSKHGTTGGKSTASVTTAEKVANPSSITFYVSKSTTNTTSSNWIVQVSSNGTSWTDVKTQSATSMTKGSWTEVTQSLSAYSNVYVRVAYSGTTAMRCIDDLTLTTGSASTPALALTPETVAFGTVDQNATVAAKTIAATLANVSSATVALSGDGASAFSLDVTSLTASGNITITPNTTTAGTYEATLTLSATGATSKTATITMTVEAPFTGNTMTLSAADDADIKFATGSNASTGALWVKSTPLSANGITLSGSVSSGTSYSYYDGSVARFYTNNNIVITPTDGVRIVKIEIVRATSTSSNTGTINCSGLTASLSNTTTNTNVFTGSATSAVTFTASVQARFTAIKVYYYGVKSQITVADCTNGSVSVKDIADLTQVASGTEVTLLNTPASGYKLEAYKVYKTGDEATIVTITDGKFTMPTYAVTVSATFVPAKEFIGTALTLSGTYPTEFWKGDTFSHEGLVATAHFNTGDETVTPTFSTPNMTTVGKQTITVTFTEGAASQTATYEITVKTIANTEATAYTVAEAFALIDAGKDLSSTVYVKGKISQVVTAWSDQYNNITYNISVDGETTSDQLQLFRCVTKDVPVQSDVVAKGTLLKFNGTYELAAGNSIVSHVAPAVVKTTATITLSTYKSSLAADEADDVLTVTYNGDGTIGATSSNEAVATVSIEGTTVTIHPVATGTATITVSAPATDTYTNATKSYTLTVTAALTAAELPFNFDGGKADVDSHVSMREKGLNTTDYSASPKLKFDSQGDEVVVRIADAAKKVTYTIKGNSYTAGQFDVLQSADNKTYTTLKSHTTISADGEAITIDQPASETRYIKFVYTTKNAGNVALGNIKIIAAGAKEDPAFSVENMSMLLEEVASPTINRGGSTGAISYTFTPGNFTESAGVFTALSVGGPVTVTATMAGDANYNEAQTTFTITVVDPATFGDAVSIVFPYDGKYYAMKSDLSVVEVIYANDKLYGIAPADKKDLTWYKKVDGETATFRTASGKYLAGSSKTNLNVVAESYSWNIDGDSYSVTISSSKRSFFMNDSYEVKNYAVSNAGNSGFSDLAVLATGFGELTTIPSTVAVGSFGTMCQAKEVLAIDGAIVYAVEKKNPIGIDLVEAEFPLTAGRPYFYQATKATVGAVYGAAEAASAQNDEANGLHGNISTAATMVGAIPVDCYVVQNDNLRRVPSVMDLPANRAYLNYEEVLDKSAGASPTRRRVTMGGVSTDTPTSVDALSQEDGATKFFENGILYIIRDGKVYNAQGQLIK